LGLCVALLAATPVWAQPTEGDAPGTSAGTTGEAGTAETFDDPRLWWRATAFACLGAGVLGLGLGGAVFASGVGDEDLVSNATRDDLGRVVSLNQREALRLQDSASSKQTLGAVGMGVGGALVAAGVVLLILEPPAVPLPTREVKPAEPEVRPFSLMPTFGPDGPGLAFGLRF
jgi:hypothetical protein